MIRSLTIFLNVMLLISCSHSSNVNNQKRADSQNGSSTDMMSVSLLLDKACTTIDKPVTVKGMVTHTCKHSGKRCFIIDSHDNKTIRIEAMGNIKTFSNDLLGTEIIVSGILRESRLDSACFSEWESKTYVEKKGAENESDHCDEELARIGEMREWMKTNGKDYYPVYYVDGQSYREIIQ